MIVATSVSSPSSKNSPSSSEASARDEPPPMTGWPDMKCSMIEPRMAGFRCCHSESDLVTVMKS
ncbi:hypothetical protein D3C86_1978310 [compost metagenome]